VVSHNALVVVSLVGLGVGMHFLTLLSISCESRETADRNLPLELPYLS
jgi:hypothetical protein